MRVAVVNQKGGVGKTTTAVNLAASLADLGRRVLLVDLDPQANATTGVGVDHRDAERSIYDVIINGMDPGEVLVPTPYERLDVLPSSIDLAGAELELVPAFSRERKLRAALERLDGRYDVVLIDCPPSLGLLTINALTAAHWTLVPIQTEYYALEGLSQLLKNVELVRQGLNPELEIRAIVLTMYDARTKLSEQVAAEVRDHFGDRVMNSIIPRSVRLSEAPSYGQPGVVYAPSSRGGMAYKWLAEEFVERFLDGARDGDGGEPVPGVEPDDSRQPGEPPEGDPSLNGGSTPTPEDMAGEVREPDPIPTDHAVGERSSDESEEHGDRPAGPFSWAVDSLVRAGSGIAEVRQAWGTLRSRIWTLSVAMLPRVAGGTDR